MFSNALTVRPVYGETFEGWEVLSVINHDVGGEYDGVLTNYAVQDGSLRLWSDVDNGLLFSKKFSPSADFEFSLQIKASNLIGFAIVIGTEQFVNHQYSPESMNYQSSFWIR